MIHSQSDRDAAADSADPQSALAEKMHQRPVVGLIGPYFDGIHVTLLE
jgi:hypothetical protein